MTPDIVDAILGTVGVLGGVGVVLNRVGLIHFGKKNGKQNDNGLVLLTQCVSHKDMVKELIATKKDVGEVKSDTSYIRGWIEAQKK